MTDLDLLTEWFTELARDIRREVEDLGESDISWQPAHQTNSIGLTVWHVARWLDLLKVRALENQDPENECWHTEGWAEKTGYDPRGIGYRGFGAITGYTWEEVEAIPKLTVPQLVAYLDQAAGALVDLLTKMPAGALHEAALGFSGERTVYQWLRPVLKGGLGHLGEIQTLKTLLSKT